MEQLSPGVGGRMEIAVTSCGGGRGVTRSD